MAVKFNQSVRHDRIELFPEIALGFEDPNADQYFINAGWAETTSDEPVRVYTADEVAIDVTTTHGTGPNRGQLVVEG